MIACFETIPRLPNPEHLWSQAAALGRRCQNIGVVPGSTDLLIEIIAIHHDAEFITFDAGFEKIAAVCEMRLKLLRRTS